MARYLVVCHITGQSQALQDELRSIAESDASAEFTVLVPATPKTYWKAWDHLEEMDRARALSHEIGALLRGKGFNVIREVPGSREPLLAIDDELRDSPGYFEIVISTLPSGSSRWLRRNLVSRVRSRFRLPVRHVEATDITVDPSMTGPADDDDDFAMEHRLPSGREPGRDPLPASIRRTLEALTEARPRQQPARGATAVAERPIEREPVAMDIAPSVLGRTLAKNRPIAEAFWSLQMQLEQRSGLEPELGELVALRIAQTRHFAQLWQEHVQIARALSIPDERIAAIEHWRSAEHVHFSARERAVLGYTDSVCDDAGNVDSARHAAEQHLDETEMLGLTLLVGFYRMSGSFEQALNLPTDGPFVGWALFRGAGGGQHL